MRTAIVLLASALTGCTQLECGPGTTEVEGACVVDEDAVTDALWVDPPFDGGTLDGLGLGASLSCFVDALGYPSSGTFWEDGDTLVLFYLSWFEQGVSASDFLGSGTASSLSLYGAEEGSYR